MGISLQEAESKKDFYIREEKERQEEEKRVLVLDATDLIDRLICINLDKIKEKSVHIPFYTSKYSREVKEAIANNYTDFTVNLHNGLSIKLATAEWKW
jgi:hypothetical protein